MGKRKIIKNRLKKTAEINQQENCVLSKNMKRTLMVMC